MNKTFALLTVLLSFAVTSAVARYEKSHGGRAGNVSHQKHH